jgi:hypothetical protein
VPINSHHHHNPFTNTHERYAISVPDVPNLAVPHHRHGLLQEPIKSVPVTMDQHALMKDKQDDTKVVTSFIPVTSMLLCEACALLFQRHRLHCDTCDFVPSLAERHNRDCSRCFQGIITRG